MKKGITINLKRFKLIDYVIQNKIFIFLFIVFIVGITLGSTILFKNAIISKNAELFLNKFLTLHKHSVFAKKFISCFFVYFLILILYFISGTSMLGVAIVPFITVWQGIIIGSTTTHLYSNYGLNGIVFNAIALIPPFAIFVITCFFAAKNSINFSLCIARLTMPNFRPLNLHLSFKNYCTKFLIFTGISVICTLIEILFSSLFLDIFNF